MRPTHGPGGDGSTSAGAHDTEGLGFTSAITGLSDVTGITDRSAADADVCVGHQGMRGGAIEARYLRKVEITTRIRSDVARPARVHPPGSPFR